MEGSESEAIFDSLKLNPQLFINEVINSVDDLVDGAFDYFHREAATLLKIEGTEKVDDLCKGVAQIRNVIQSVLDKRLTMWEKYCLRHCFMVPEGISLPNANESSGDISMDLDSPGDAELDMQLTSLREKLALVVKESAELNQQLQALERQSLLSTRYAALVNEALQLYEQKSIDEMFQELIGTSFQFHAKVEKLKNKRAEETMRGRMERMQVADGDLLRTTWGNGLFNLKLEELQEFIADIKTA